MWINRILWLIYIALLFVLWPHTSWAFAQFEQGGWWQAIGWIAAFAFEAAIAAFTWRLKQLIEKTPNYRTGLVWLRRWRYRYVNPYGFGLLAALIISAIANWAHAVEFGRSFRVFADYSVSPTVFSISFGAILPAVSFLFARVLAEAQDTEEEVNQDLVEAKETIKELRKQLREAKDARTLAEERFGAVGDLVHYLFAEEKRLRILAIKQLWPQLPGKTIANMTEASQSYVSEVLTSSEGITIEQG